MATSFFGGAFFDGEFFNEGVVETEVPTERTSTPGGIDPGEGIGRRRIVKPTGIEPRRKTLTLPKKSPTPTERIEDARALQAEVAATLATEFAADNAARSRGIVVPIVSMPLAQIEAEIAMLLRKKLRTEEDEIMLMVLMISAVA